jgi:hypothetical protein
MATSRPVQTVFIRPHALERFQEHHPDATRFSLCRELERATEVEGAFLAPFLGRRLEGVRDRYKVAQDGWGVFVLALNRNPEAFFPWVLVTYLRFGVYQRETMVRLLGIT